MWRDPWSDPSMIPFRFVVCLQPSLFSRTKDDPSYDIDLEKHPETLGRNSSLVGLTCFFLKKWKWRVVERESVRKKEKGQQKNKGQLNCDEVNDGKKCG